MAPLKKLKPRTFRWWGNDVFQYMKHLPGNTVHIIFDNYTYEYNVPTKDQSIGTPRIIANIDQNLSNGSEQVDFLGNPNNKNQFIDLLVKYLLEELFETIDKRHT